MEEKRRALRVRTSIDISWGKTRACAHPGTITNLTVLGCAVHDKKGVKVRPGQTVFIRFWMPREHLLKGEIVHTDLKGAQGFGVAFLNLTAEDEETLEQIVQLFGELAAEGE
jgi:hypothetical protein